MFNGYEIGAPATRIAISNAARCRMLVAHVKLFPARVCSDDGRFRGSQGFRSARAIRWRITRLSRAELILPIFAVAASSSPSVAAPAGR